ncbi:uncharacterized protein [Centruroides vittatus]|uniref:uncharacterized protein n=1 Tax=Centruroides vittatus TaxID=120091 RepID=UPI0035107440
MLPITEFTESPSSSEASMLNISSTVSVDSTLTTPFNEIEHSNKSSTTNISETTFIFYTNGYTLRCRGIMEMGDEPIFTLPCETNCTTEENVTLNFIRNLSDLFPCGKNKRCLNGNCVKTPNPLHDKHCRRLFPRRNTLAIKHRHECKMICYDTDDFSTSEVAVANSTPCKNGICIFGKCIQRRN